MPLVSLQLRLCSRRDPRRIAPGRPGQPAALGVPPRDRPVRRPHLGASRRPRPPRADRRRPSDSRTAIRESRKAIRAAKDDPDSLFADENPRLLAVGQRIPLPSGPRRRPPPIPVDVSRSLEQLFERVDVRHRPRPRALRSERRVGGPSPLALAERRDVPRARREGALDPGGADARRDVLRADRRADGEQRGDRGSDRALLPGRLRADPSRARQGRAGAGAGARGPAPHRPLRRGGAGSAAALPARAAPPARRPRLGGGDLVRRAHRPARAGQPQAARAPAAASARATASRPQALAGADICVPRFGRGPAGAARRSRRARGRRDAGRLPPRALPGDRRRRRARPDLPGRRLADPGGPDRAAGTDPALRERLRERGGSPARRATGAR